MEVVIVPLAEDPAAFRARIAAAWKDLVAAVRGRALVLRVDPGADPVAQAANAAYAAIAFRALAAAVLVEDVPVAGPVDPAVREAYRAARAGGAGRALVVCACCGAFEGEAPGGRCPRCGGEAAVWPLGAYRAAPVE